MYENIPLRVKETSGELTTTPQNVYDLMKDTAELAQEAFTVITLNTKNKVINRHMVSLGTLNTAVVAPREVFRVAILDGAASIILSHNHPSGDPTPSSEDIKITKQLISGGEIMAIKVLDHVIIGDTFVSIRECGLCEFQ